MVCVQSLSKARNEAISWKKREILDKQMVKLSACLFVLCSHLWVCLLV